MTVAANPPPLTGLPSRREMLEVCVDAVLDPPPDAAVPRAWFSAAKIQLAVGFVVGQVCSKMPDVPVGEVFEACFERTAQLCYAADRERGRAEEDILLDLEVALAAVAELRSREPN